MDPKEKELEELKKKLFFMKASWTIFIMEW